MFKLRRNQDQLECFHRQKEHHVQKAREELRLCRRNVDSLLAQRMNLEKELEQQKAKDDSVAVFRLRAQHKQLCQQLQNEEELEGRIRTELRQREWELIKVEVELGKVSMLRQEVQEEEELFQTLKAQKAATRLQQERKVGQNLQHELKLLRDKQEASLRKEEMEYQKKLEEGKKYQRIAVKYLNESLKKKRAQQQAAEKEQQSQELIEKRIQVVMSLKSSIAANQENLRVQQKKIRADALKKEHEDRKLRESLQTQGIDSFKHMYRLKQQEETKQKQEEFEESQKSKREAIAAKILQEEQLINSRNQALLHKPSNDKSSALRKKRKSHLHYLHCFAPSVTKDTALINIRNFSDISSSSSSSSDVEDLEETGENSQEDVVSQRLPDSLFEPEFSGLWEQDSKKPITEKMTLVQTEENKEEVAAASERFKPRRTQENMLKGPPFISKPEVIIFKDFDVGKLYKKKILLTNSGYTMNHCKLLRVSPQLSRFISVNFEPSGPISAGMSSSFQAIFLPTINEDLEGEIHFMSAAGPFSVPVRCNTKKCRLEVDSQFIDFGSHVVGQTILRTISLTNKGALATLFSLDTSTHLSPETSHVQMPSQAFASMSLEKSSENLTCSVSSMGAEQVQPDQQNLDFSEVSPQSVKGPETVTDRSSDVSTPTEQNPSETSEITLGRVIEGEIGSFQTIKLEILFTPTIPGETKLDFYIKFSDINTKPIPIQARGMAVGSPVSIFRPIMDMKICMYDRLYQDIIVVQSRASAAVKLTFEICPEMREHMEIIPESSFIQAQSTFNAQLRFKPRHSLSKDAEKYFDNDTGVLEVPMTVKVAGQVQPATFTVYAIVTSSDLQFDQTEVDFGDCSIYNPVRSSVCLTNMSILPQDFGFPGVPECIKIRPNDGFGTLLPQETLKFDLIFSPKIAKEHHFQLICKSGINRDFPLLCRAVAFHPPLQLSQSLVQFRATAVGDKSTALLHLTYQQSKQTATAPIKDATTVEAPRLFCFTLPKDSNISISPSAGRLLPGERCLVLVTFRPRLSDDEIKEEARRRLPQESPVVHSKWKKLMVNQSDRKVSKTIRTKNPDPVNIHPESEQYKEAKAFLLCSFTQSYKELVIPCFVSDGDPPETDRQIQPPWSPINTLYLKLQCPAVQPPLVVVSNNGHNVVDFHQVLVGERIIQRLIIKNISNESLDLRSSILDTTGPFSLVNALRCIHPGQTHTLVLAFSPTLGKKHYEILEIQSLKMDLEISLCGEGVLPEITSSHTGSLLDFGFVLEKETTSKCVQLQNKSKVAVGFRVLLDSLCPSKTQMDSDRVLLLGGSRSSQVQPSVGTQNYSGLSVFGVTPVEGSIAPGKKQDITITFQPDHPSVNYSDKLTVELKNKSEVCVMSLKGAASSHNMFLHGGDLRTVPTESLVPSSIFCPSHLTESELTEGPSIPVLVTLRASHKAGVIIPGVRELHVGCICSKNTKVQRAEFYWDNVEPLEQQGFTVTPIRGSVEAGGKCAVTITWTPRKDHKPFEVLQRCVTLTIKGDETIIYRVTLMAVFKTAD
nr:cilia- and flagella-associated protein 74 [Nothobranchius furzeri]